MNAELHAGDSVRAPLLAALASLNQVLLGKDREVRLALACLLARGHLLIEDIPGVGKTTLAHALARVLGLSYQRIQFTSDLLPADVIGVSIYDRASGRFRFNRGPVFAQLVMADEVNRATPKAQSALLEAMEERQVTVDGETHAAAGAVLHRRDPESLVPGRHLPAAGVAGRPLPDAHRARLPGRQPRARTAARPRPSRPARRPAGRCWTPRRSRRCSSASPRCTRATPCSTTCRRSRALRATAAGTRPASRRARSSGCCARRRPGPSCTGTPGVLPEDLQAVLPSVVGHRLRPRDADGRPRTRRGRRRTHEHGANPLRAAHHSAAYSAKRALRGWVHDWIRQRQGPDRETVTLRRGRIYILPTGLGAAFGVMLVAMLLGSLNYGNNLGLALTFLLAALGVVAMHACHRNLEQLVARPAGTEPPFAGQDAVFRIALANPGPLPRSDLEAVAGVTTPPAHVPAAGEATLELRRADASPRQRRPRARRDRDPLSLRPVPRLGGAASRNVLPRVPASARPTRRRRRGRPDLPAAAPCGAARTTSRD